MYVISRSHDGWRWRLERAGRVLAKGTQSYADRQDALRAIEIMRSASEDNEVEEEDDIDG